MNKEIEKLMAFCNLKTNFDNYNKKIDEIIDNSLNLTTAQLNLIANLFEQNVKILNDIIDERKRV